MPIEMRVQLPSEKLEPGMTVVTKGIVSTFVIETISEDHVLDTGSFEIDPEMIDYVLLDLETAIRLEDDPIKKIALQILADDPIALDIARDLC